MYFRRWNKSQAELTDWVSSRYTDGKAVAFTLTMRQRIDVADGQIMQAVYLDPRKAQLAVQRFKHVLNILLFGKNYKRRKEGVNCDVFLERGKLGRYHLHGLVAIPTSHRWHHVWFAIQNAWNASPFGRGRLVKLDAVFQVKAWVKYCLKEGDQALVL